MRSLWLGVLLLAVESLAFGQLDSDTLTVTASRSYTPQHDQIVFRIYVTRPVSAGLDEAAASLKSAGITAATFSSVYSPDNLTLAWLFNLAIPFSKIPATVAQLTALKIDFSVLGSQVSAETQQAQQCQVASMMADAKSQAKKLADAAELVAGEVLSLSSGQALNQTPFVALSKAPSPRAVLGGTISGVISYAVPIQPAVRGTCSLTVKFKLLRYHY